MNSSLSLLLVVLGQLCPVTTDSATVCPRQTSYWTGRVREDHARYSGNLGIIVNPPFRGWAKFDLSPIPDGSEITAARLVYNFYSSSGEATACWRHLRTDPVTASGATVWNECATGTLVAPDSEEVLPGPMNRPLNGSGLAAIRAGLAFDWVAFGWIRTGFTGPRYARGIESPGEVISMVVHYSPPGAVEEPGAAAGRTRLSVRPNPARRRLLVELDRGVRVFAVRVSDVTGRAVLQSEARQKGGAVEVDVSELPAGLYFVEAMVPGGSGVRGKFVKQ